MKVIQIIGAPGVGKSSTVRSFLSHTEDIQVLTLPDTRHTDITYSKPASVAVLGSGYFSEKKNPGVDRYDGWGPEVAKALRYTIDNLHPELILIESVKMATKGYAQLIRDIADQSGYKYTLIFLYSRQSVLEAHQMDRAGKVIDPAFTKKKMTEAETLYRHVLSKGWDVRLYCPDNEHTPLDEMGKYITKSI